MGDGKVGIGVTDPQNKLDVDGFVGTRGVKFGIYESSSLPACNNSNEGLLVLTQGKSSSDQILCYCHDTPEQGGRKWSNLMTGQHGSSTTCPGPTKLLTADKMEVYSFSTQIRRKRGCQLQPTGLLPDEWYGRWRGLVESRHE